MPESQFPKSLNLTEQLLDHPNNIFKDLESQKQPSNYISIAREGLDWILGKISPLKKLSSPGTDCSGSGSHHPCLEGFKTFIDVVLGDMG